MAKNPMTKEELVAHFAKKFKVSKASTDRWFNELSRVAAKEARKGFKIPGVGKLVVVKRKAQRPQFRHWGTHENPGQNVLQFRIAKACNEVVFGK
ncbi:MAG: HU family DNA-binding protein [bacterium]